jgi:hypothetical protein
MDLLADQVCLVHPVQLENLERTARKEKLACRERRDSKAVTVQLDLLAQLG